MAKAKATVSVDALIDLGLGKFAAGTGPFKLSGKTTDALFASTGAEKKAGEEAIAGGWIAVVGSGKTATVRLTPAGFSRIAGSLAPEQVGPLAKTVAEPLPLGERIAFLQDAVSRVPVAAVELLPVLEASIAEEKAEAAEREAKQARQRELEIAAEAAIKRWLELSGVRKEERIASLKRQLAAEGASSEPVVEKPVGPAPTTPGDHSFRRSVAVQLVASWRATFSPDRPEIREFIESAIWNVRGMKVIGEPGEAVEFDGRLHEGPAGLFTGNPAKIVRPGWLIEEGGDAEFVVQKAHVEKRG